MWKFISLDKRDEYGDSAADIIISRAGALSISELCIIGKPTILGTPSPNVSEDHQTKNAMALVNKNAAVLVRYRSKRKIRQCCWTTKDEIKLNQLSENIKTLAKTNAANDIVNTITGEIQKS